MLAKALLFVENDTFSPSTSNAPTMKTTFGPLVVMATANSCWQTPWPTNRLFVAC